MVRGPNLDKVWKELREDFSYNKDVAEHKGLLVIGWGEGQCRLQQGLGLVEE